MYLNIENIEKKTLSQADFGILKLTSLTWKNPARLLMEGSALESNLIPLCFLEENVHSEIFKLYNCITCTMYIYYEYIIKVNLMSYR